MKHQRLNFEANEDCVTVCRGKHDSGQPCEYEELSPHEVVEILNEMRSKLLRVEVLLQQIELAKLDL